MGRSRGSNSCGPSSAVKRDENNLTIDSSDADGNGILVRRAFMDIVLQKCSPAKLLRVVLYNVHSPVSAGFPGSPQIQMYNIMRREHCWPHMSKDLYRWVEACVAVDEIISPINTNATYSSFSLEASGICFICHFGSFAKNFDSK